MVLGRRHEDLEELALTLLNVDVANEQLQHQQNQGAQSAEAGQGAQTGNNQQQAAGPHAAHLLGEDESEEENDRFEQHRTPRRATGALVAGALLARRQREAAHVQAVARDDSVVRRKAQQAKAGKRRQRRWQNNVFLKSLARRLAEDSGVDPESREFAAELRNTGVTYENDTPLDTLFKDWRCMQRWLAFDKLPAREQYSMVMQRTTPAKPRQMPAANELQSAKQCYTRISRYIRNQFSRSLPAEEMVERMEAAVTAHFALGAPQMKTPDAGDVGDAIVPAGADVHVAPGVFALPQVGAGSVDGTTFAEQALAEMAAPGTTAEVLEVQEESAYHRLVLHAVCQFHALQSHSVNQNGVRLTRIRRQAGVPSGACVAADVARPALSLAAWLYSGDPAAPSSRKTACGAA